MNGDCRQLHQCVLLKSVSFKQILIGHTAEDACSHIHPQYPHGIACASGSQPHKRFFLEWEILCKRDLISVSYFNRKFWGEMGMNGHCRKLHQCVLLKSVSFKQILIGHTAEDACSHIHPHYHPLLLVPVGANLISVSYCNGKY